MWVLAADTAGMPVLKRPDAHHRSKPLEVVLPLAQDPVEERLMRLAAEQTDGRHPTVDMEELEAMGQPDRLERVPPRDWEALRRVWSRLEVDSEED